MQWRFYLIEMISVRKPRLRHLAVVYRTMRTVVCGYAASRRFKLGANTTHPAHRHERAVRYPGARSWAKTSRLAASPAFASRFDPSPLPRTSLSASSASTAVPRDRYPAQPVLVIGHQLGPFWTAHQRQKFGPKLIRSPHRRLSSHTSAPPPESSDLSVLTYLCH